MHFLNPARVVQWLPKFSYQVWLLALGRLLSQLGSGFTLFNSPIFFTTEVGLSRTLVGIGIGSASISGVLGRILGGSLADSPKWGRKRTLMLALMISAIASLVIAIASNFPTFLIGNLLMGFGIGLYWPANEAAVADLTAPEQRNEAYAITRLADSIGLGLGVVLGGWLVSAAKALRPELVSAAYRSLFVIDGITFLVFLAVLYWAIAETLQPQTQPRQAGKGWGVALRDRALLVYVLVNILLTTYLIQVSSTMPLYFSDFVPTGEGTYGFETATISALFTWHIALSIVCQIPVARLLNRLSRPRSLMISSSLWGIGFILIWFTGVANSGNLIWAILGLGILALATAAYMPAASSLVVELAPDSLRGIYLAVNSQCWAIGYFIGPPLGGWALDQPRPLADNFWLATAASAGVGLWILQYLQRLMRQQRSEIK